MEGREHAPHHTYIYIYLCVCEGRSGDRGDHNDDDNAEDEDAHGKELSQPVEGSRPSTSTLSAHDDSVSELGRLFGSARHIRRPHFPRAALGRDSRRIFSLRRALPMVLRCC